MGRKNSIGSSFPTSFLSITLIPLPFSIVSLAVASLLLFPLLFPLWPFLAFKRCFTIGVLINYQFFQLSPFLRSSAPKKGSLPTIFRKMVGTTLPFCRGILLLFSFPCSYSLHFCHTKCGQISHSFRPRQRPTSSLVVS